MYAKEVKESRSIYVIEFIIGFILSGIGALVLLPFFLHTGFMLLYFNILYPFRWVELLYGLCFSFLALSIGPGLMIEGYSRFKKIGMIQSKERKHFLLESTPAKVSGKKSLPICFLIYIIGLIVSVVLLLKYNLLYK